MQTRLVGATDSAAVNSSVGRCMGLIASPFLRAYQATLNTLSTKMKSRHSEVELDGSSAVRIAGSDVCEVYKPHRSVAVGNADRRRISPHGGFHASPQHARSIVFRR